MVEWAFEWLNMRLNARLNGYFSQSGYHASVIQKATVCLCVKGCFNNLLSGHRLASVLGMLALILGHCQIPPPPPTLTTAVHAS